MKKVCFSPQQTSVLILAAGRGNRMRPLTDKTPKPLLKVGELSLVEHHLVRLAQQGFQHIVINIAYLGEQIMTLLGDGQKYQLNIEYSDERDTGALETAGGIKKAINKISSDQFIVINGDIWTDIAFSVLLEQEQENCIILSNNPPHNPNGDFALDEITNTAQRISSTSKASYTFTGVGKYSKNLFQDIPVGKQALAPLLFKCADEGSLGATIHLGKWLDIGTPERLKEVQVAYASSSEI